MPVHLPTADGWPSAFQLQLLEPQEQQEEKEDEMGKKGKSE